MKKGNLCFSLDLELLWGKHSLSDFSKFVIPMKKERMVIKRLLALSKKYDFPITWAVVGHLFLDQCKKNRNISHPEIKKPNFSWLKRDWMERDPGTNLEKDPLWYGKDIVEEIKKIKNQEIASHSFSHVPFGSKECTAEVAESELKTCVDLAKKEGIGLNSFIFPYNLTGHLSLLKKYGFISFRGIQPNIIFAKGTLLTLCMVYNLLSPSPSVSKPSLVEGLVNIPASMYFFSSRGLKKIIPSGTRFNKAKKGINKAIKKKKVFHLWTHPVDLTDESSFMELEEIIKYASEKRKSGLLEIKTMKNIAIDFLANN